MIAVNARRTVTTQAVRVACQECSTTVAEVRDGHLVIRSRHHGETHTTILSLRALVQLLDEQAA